MKKIIFSALLLALGATIFAFTSKNPDQGQIRITVTADTPTNFDFHVIGNAGKNVMGATTPFETTVSKDAGRYMLKLSKPGLTMTAEGPGAKVTAQWNIIVLLVENGNLTTFGID